MTALAWVCLVLAGAGCLYLGYAVSVAAGFVAEPAQALAEWPAVTILKPLRGDEPALSRCLTSFIGQDYPAPVEIVFGVQAADDPAIDVVRRLEKDASSRNLRLVVDESIHGPNRKIGNLINMSPAIRHQVVVLADSDIEAPEGYLRRVAAALSEPGVGGVTCLYRGVPAAGLWSRLSALGIDAHFLPNVLVGLRLGMATPCFGSTIALRRGDLDAIGGFAAFSNVLADDYAIGAALRDQGLTVAVPGFLVGHHCAERSLAEVWRHELRWARTIRSVDPRGHLGSIVTHPLPFALLAAATGAPVAGLALASLAVACRIVLLHALRRGHDGPPPAVSLVPLRDLLSFAVFVWSFCGHKLTWRGRRYRVAPDGVLTAD